MKFASSIITALLLVATTSVNAKTNAGLRPADRELRGRGGGGGVGGRGGGGRGGGGPRGEGRETARQCCGDVAEAECNVFEAGSECQEFIDDETNMFTGCVWDAEENEGAGRCKGIRPPRPGRVDCKDQTVDTCGVDYTTECQAFIDDTTNNFEGCLWNAEMEQCRCLKSEDPDDEPEV